LPWLAELTQTSLVNREKRIPKINSSDLDNLEVTSASADSVWVPNRNGLFINIAAVFADRLKAQVILTGFNQEEAATFPDNSKEFAEAITKSLFFSTQVQSRVESFTQTMTKEGIVREALKRDFPLEIVWSCYEGGEKMCGICESCLRSKRAYEKAGIWSRLRPAFER
jgi:7-cyano-7-deazaguanine synthase